MGTCITYIDIRSLQSEEESLTALLRPERQGRVRQCQNSKSRIRCIAGGLLMEQAAGERQIQFNEQGKPFLEGGPYFNISHSGDYVCMAFSTVSELGIDIEIRRDQNFDSLTRIAFHPEERAFFAKAPSPERFFRIWTMKESYVKMLGKGFALEPASFSLAPWLENHDQEIGRAAWFQHFDDTIPGYSISLCMAARPPEPVSKFRHYEPRY